MGDYFEEGLPQDHDNDDSDIADEAEDHVNMLEVELSHGNLCTITISTRLNGILDTCSNGCDKQWKMLYDEVEHKHLQQAIISHLV